MRAVNDDIDDDDEYLTLSFGTLPELVYAGDQATVRINLVDDDDPPVQVFFEHANYEVTSTYRSGPRVYARLDVTVQLSAIPERFVDVGIVPESIQGGGNIRLGYSSYIPRGPHSGAAFDADETEFTVTVVMSATDEFDADQTYRLRFEGMSYRMSAGSPATATITIDPAQTSEPASQDWPADTTTRAVLTLDQCVDGRFDHAAGDTDWIKMHLQAGQGYVVNIERSAGAHLETGKVYDTTGMNPANLEDRVNSGSGHFRSFYRAPADGIHYFQIKTFSGTGNYRLCLYRDDHGSTRMTATEMQVSQSVTGSLWREGDRGPVIRDTDSFKVPLVANRTYRVEVQGAGENGVDVGGTLADPQVTLARILPDNTISYLQDVSANGGTGKNESYTFTATHTTEYYIEVYDGSSPDKGGTYTVSVEDIT